MRCVRGLIGLTDFDWYTQLAATPSLPEVNFWLPGGHASVKIIGPGDPFFFQLKAPHNAIAGFGTFVRSCPATAAQAWDAFGAMNGARSHAELLERISYYRAKHGRPVQPGEDPEIGCVLLTEPVFFPRADWVRRPADWPANTERWKSYDLAAGEGARLWADCRDRARVVPIVAEEAPRYGAAQFVEPRLGQGAFRLAVTDAWRRACAVTEEHSLPALEAAHIRRYRDGGPHSLRNGLLLRADIHRLFDRGYVSVDPDGVFRVSPLLRRDFKNGKSYYQHDGRRLVFPEEEHDRPDPALLMAHFEGVFKRE